MSAIYAEASKPQKKMQECTRCKRAGYPNQPIAFEKVGEDPATGKIIWKLLDENGQEHKHKTSENAGFAFRRRVIDIAAVTSVDEARKLLALGWDYQTSYPATLANIPHYILVKKE